MKVDIYTKIILTVIAVCLTVIVLRDINIVSEAHAQAQAQARARELASGEDVINVQLVGIKKTHRAPWDNLPVEVKNRNALDVKVKNLMSIPVTIR
jgi:hypothetical protein